MRKLVIAVIIFSFLGYGPLKGYFQEHHMDVKSISQLFNHRDELLKDNPEIKTIIAQSEKLIADVFKNLDSGLNQKNPDESGEKAHD
jgi:CHASE3 domain sensor protein